MLIDERMADLAKLLDVATKRQRVHAGNIANAQTPGFRAKAVAFDQEFRAALEKGHAERARSVEPEIYEPRTTAVDNDGNDVSMDREVAVLAQNATLYQTYISLMRGKQQLLRTAIRSTN